jgi:hypothetical protein
MTESVAPAARIRRNGCSPSAHTCQEAYIMSIYMYQGKIISEQTNNVFSLAVSLSLSLSEGMWCYFLTGPMGCARKPAWYLIRFSVSPLVFITVTVGESEREREKEREGEGEGERD